MQYTFIKNNFSRSKRYEVLDIHDKPAFYVSKISGKIFTSDFSMLEEKTQKEIHIQHYYSGFKQIYAILIEGQKVAELKRKFKVFKSSFVMECMDGTDYQIESNSWRKIYKYSKGDEPVATLERKLVKWRRRYEMTLLQMKHQELLLASVIAIDHIYEMDNST